MNKHCLTCNTEFTVGNYSCFCDKTCSDMYHKYLKHNTYRYGNCVSLGDYLNIMDWLATDKTPW